jgi:hypothetical protein
MPATHAGVAGVCKERTGDAECKQHVTPFIFVELLLSIIELD